MRLNGIVPAAALIMAASLAVVAVAPGFSATRRTVWIDTDPSVEPGGHEVDDGFALLQAFGSTAEIAIRGVSIVFGNTDLVKAERIGRRMVKRYGPRGLRQYVGARGPSDLGHATDASRALTAALKHERLTIIALGPMTNIATVLKLEPDLADRIDEIVAVAGRRPDQHFVAGASGGRPLRDFNLEMDPAAFQVVLDSKAPLTLTPWEVGGYVWITRRDLDLLAPASRGVASMLTAANDWLKRWKNQFGTDGFNPFDTLAVGYIVDPSTISCAEMSARLESGPDDAQPGAEKPYLIARASASGRRVKYCYSATPAFKNRLIQRLETSAR